MKIFMFLLDLKQWMQSKNVMYDGNNDISGIFARFSGKVFGKSDTNTSKTLATDAMTGFK